MLFCVFDCFFFFKQKTAYEMRISDWSSDVCSSDLEGDALRSWCMASETRAWERVRALGPPDWPSIVRVMEVRELPVEAGDLVEAHNGWLCGDEIDTPCKIGRASCRERVCQYV